MKNKFLLIICLFAAFTSVLVAQAASIHSYAAESVLSQGRFIKVQITETGVYKLTYTELEAKGINPSNVSMFGYGGAMLEENFSKPKHVDLPEIAVYDTGDAILFYAQGINNKAFDHKLNPYSSHGYYFISDEVGTKKRILQRAELNTGSSTIEDKTSFTDYQVYEQELYNIIKTGREFYGEKFSSESSIDIPFHFPNITAESMIVELNVINISTRTVNSSGVETNNNRSTFSLSLDGGQTKSFDVSGRNGYDAATPSSIRYNFTPGSADNIVFNLAFTNSREPTASGYLNYLKVSANRKLKMAGTLMPFYNTGNTTSAAYHRNLLETNNNSNIVIWDVNDILNVQRIPTSEVDGKLAFVNSVLGVQSYVAIDMTATSTIPDAVLLNDIPNQNIHGMEQVDMLIITHPNFIAPAERLAQAHLEISGLKVGIVTTEQVYNEFSSGTPDASAYRWVAKMFYDKAQDSADRLKYLLLIGKGSHDNRGLFQETGDNFVLTFQAVNSLSQTKSYVTDDYFGLLGDNEGTSIGYADKIDIGIGRFSVKKVEEAEVVVAKTIAYMRNENKGAWKNQLCFIGDNGDSNTHMRQADGFADRMSSVYPSYSANKILLDAYQQDLSLSDKGYPDAERKLHDLFKSGLFFVNYMGHGTQANLGSVLNTVEIKALENEHLPLVTAGTCEFSRFDRGVVTGAEELLNNSSGGGIGVFSATRTVYSDYNKTLMEHFCDFLFALPNGNRGAVGDAIMKAKNASFVNTNLGINTLSYVYFGDPAVRLNYPVQYKVVATEINGDAINGSNTLEALSVVTVKGIVADENGQKIDDFNGNLQMVVQDKKQTIRTLQNSYTYTDRPDVVFKGKATVENGEFEVTFMMPKNIKPNNGGGRLNFYAWNDDYEAQGYNENFIIGGVNGSFVDEQDGPEAKIYLNNRNFVSGGKVNETPIFGADLFDQNGINTSWITPGHDIMLCIDNETWFRLNDHYEMSQADYQRGTINFQLPEQTEGKHILMFRVWDLLNNSTTKTLEFEVVKGLDTRSFAISCYPNPAVTQANIQVSYPQEDEIANVVLDIFDLSGRKIWSKSQKSLDTISWNLMKENGESVSSGMYIYRVSIQTNDNIISTKSDKIIVTKQ